MPHLPLISRLSLQGYIALVLSFALIFLESVISLITIFLPRPVIHFCYRTSKRAFNALSSAQGRRSRNKKKAIVNSIAQAADFCELCELWGYQTEEHIVQTGDGYLLGLHRLGWRKGEEGRVNVAGGTKKPVVYLHHGLMMNSEVWVCVTEHERCLPFLLVERGYDVWLGNNRGNKYSKKSLNRLPTSPDFWSFSIDEFAFHDIPDSISYILSTTNAPSLSYIGFSQGTAQAFATLSIHPTLNDKVDLFIALAPAMAPGGLTSQIVDSFVKASPDVLFLSFGRRALLGSATMWEAILYPPIFVRLIDYSLRFLFGWQARNITPHQKLAAYPHLYSFTSVKSVVHWFQIIRNGTFQMYDDEVQGPLSFARQKYYKIAKYPTRNIRTPIFMVYGGSDSLVDIKVMLKELPKGAIVKEIPHYEHLDFLWASDTDKLVFPLVYEALESYRNKALMTRPETPILRSTLNAPAFPDDDMRSPDDLPRKISENDVEIEKRADGSETPEGSSTAARDHSDALYPSSPGDYSTTDTHDSPTAERFSGRLADSVNASQIGQRRSPHPNSQKSQLTAKFAANSPVQGGATSAPDGLEGGSTSSSESHAKIGSRGIQLGASKPVAGVLDGGRGDMLRAGEETRKRRGKP